MKFFGDKAVLNDVNLVCKGEFVTILDRPAAKTTLLRLIAGFQTAPRRVITIASDITQTPPHKRPVNTVFRSTPFPVSHLNVQQHCLPLGLTIVSARCRLIEKVQRQALRMVGMTHTDGL